MKTLLTFCLILIGLAGFAATGADAAPVHRSHERLAYYHHHRYHHYYHHHHRYYYRHGRRHYY